ncbi:Type I restriction/modification specificity protein [Photobacterium kishitanii]|nr:Type I restriction/modification specificity protein [Photobacterium kishitanii]
MGELFGYPRFDGSCELKRVELTEKELDKNQLVCGDLIFARRSLTAEGAGKCSIIRKLSEPTGFESSIIRARLDQTKADPEYFYYLFNSPFGKWLLGTILRQVAVSGITGSDLAKLEVPVPPLNEQSLIAKQAISIDDKVAINTSINQSLEQMAQAIFKSWFVDFDPVKAKMNGEQPEGMDTVTASLFPEKLVESELGLIPDGWNIESIKDFGNVICGKTPSKKNADFYGGDVPFIKIPDTHGKVFITETSDTLTKAGDESQPKKRIPENSICVSCIATVGQVFITTKPSHTNQQINSVVPYDQNSLYYLLFKFKGLNKHFHDLASGGSATLNMNTSTFSKVALVRPTADVLEAFHKTVGGLMEKMLANQLENTTLSELRDTLLPKLLSGEIELGTSEELVEAI